jgi:hypothetical protein
MSKSLPTPNLMLRLAAASTLLFISSASCWGQVVVPSETELRAAYCLSLWTRARDLLIELDKSDPVAKGGAGAMPEGIEAENNDRINRLQSYLLPRLAALEGTAVLLAMSRGRADHEAGIMAAKQCFASCAPLPSQVDEISCFRSCTDRANRTSSRGDRAAMCRDLSWLPF